MTDFADQQRIEKIAQLNDQLRQATNDAPSMSAYKKRQPCSVFIAPDACAVLSDDDQPDLFHQAFARVAAFNDFSSNNNPHGERDFGQFTLLTHAFYWKIDYYDANKKYASPDPSDPAQTHRVLTLMLTSEY